jgi:hypothetical protein
VFGGNFVDVPALQCRFGSGVSPVAAKWVSTSELSCSAPPAVNESTVVVAVTLNGEEFSVSSHAAAGFTYHEDVTVVDVAPARGPLVGGSPVIVGGTGFLPTPFLSCRFGDVVVPASWRSDAQVSCDTPAAALPGPVSVSVSLNAGDYSSSFALFTYDSVPHVLAVTPSAGSVEGGTPVSVEGSGFGNTTTPPRHLCDRGSVSEWRGLHSGRRCLPVHP